MHICMVAFTDLRFDYRIFREASTLARAGYRVTVVSPQFDNILLLGWKGINVVTVPMCKTWSLRRLYPYFWRISTQILLSQKADVYHAHDLDSLLPAVISARKFGSRLVYDSHELFTEQSSLVRRPWIRAFWQLLEKNLIRNANCVITVSDSIAGALCSKYALSRVHVVRNLPPYRIPVKSNIIRNTLGLDPNLHVVLYQGGFLTDNGLKEQIQVAETINNAALVLIGDGPCERILREEVCKRRLDDRVFFIPRVPFNILHEYTCSADIGLCLIKGTGRSFYYSMPNKLFEYVMAGLPIIGSDFPEISRVIRDCRCGEVISPTDLKQIANCISNLLDKPNVLKRYSKNAICSANRYSWEQEAPRLLEVYEKL